MAIIFASSTLAASDSQDSDNEILNPVQSKLQKLKEVYDAEKEGALCDDNPVVAAECAACDGMGTITKSQCCRSGFIQVPMA